MNEANRVGLGVMLWAIFLQDSFVETGAPDIVVRVVTLILFSLGSCLLLWGKTKPKQATGED